MVSNVYSLFRSGHFEFSCVFTDVLVWILFLALNNIVEIEIARVVGRLSSWVGDELAQIKPFGHLHSLVRAKPQVSGCHSKQLDCI